jgi:predicted ATPase
MLIQTNSNGQKAEHEIPQQVKCLVHQQGIKVKPLDADLEITPKTTVACMEKMSQKAWEHISTGPLFQHFFNTLFEGQAHIPPTITEFLEDSDEGIIHGAGLIIELVEARFAGKNKVFIRTPENSLHPRAQRYLMTVIDEICKIPGPHDELLAEVGL